jgi:hypothetical protein
MKPTPHAHVALARLAAPLQVPLLSEGLTLVVGTKPPLVMTEQRKTVRYCRALAYLIRVATLGKQFGGYGLTHDQIRALTQYEGPPPQQGLAGHEEAVLLGLIPEALRRRSRKA